MAASDLPDGLSIRPITEPLAELAMMKAVHSGLVATGDGVELIVHRLPPGR